MCLKTGEREPEPPVDDARSSISIEPQRDLDPNVPEEKGAPSALVCTSTVIVRLCPGLKALGGDMAFAGSDCAGFSFLVGETAAIRTGQGAIC